MRYYSYISSVMREILNPLNNMNTIPILPSLNEIIDFAENNTAAEFNAWCESQGIELEWLDITLTDINKGYYNVILPEYDLNVMYYHGELTYIDEL